MTVPWPLPQQSDLELIYGAENVRMWADADNDRSGLKREARIAWAVEEGYRYILGRLALRLDITQFVTAPEEVFSLIARRAGIELAVSPRGLVDGDPNSAMLNMQSLRIEVRLDDILSGRFRMLDLPAASIPDHLMGVNNSTERMHDPLRDRDDRYQRSGFPPFISDDTNFYQA